MRVRRLAVRHFGPIAEAEVELGPGLNVLHGPNDIGKSTLASAIRLALLLPSTSRAAEPLSPWTGGGPPTVDLVLELGPQRFLRIRKEYAGNRGTAVLESSRDGRSFVEEHKGRGVDGEIRRMLGWGIAEPGGAGGQKGVPESFLGTVLLGPQDDVDGLLARSLDGDDVASGRDRVAQALQALARDPQFVGILAAAQARYDEAWTATGQVRRGAGGRLKEVAETVTRANKVREGYQKLVEETSHVQTELGALTTRHDVAADALRLARERREALERDAEAAGKRGRAAQAVDEARAALAAIDALGADLEAGRATVARLAADVDAAAAERERCRAVRDEAAAAHRSATSAPNDDADHAVHQSLRLAAADAERRRTEARDALRTAEAADRAHQALTDAQTAEDEARRERETATEALAASVTGLATAEQDLGEWRRLEAAVAAAEVAAEAVAQRAALVAAETARDALAERRREASTAVEEAAAASRRAEADLAALSHGDEARRRGELAVAEARRVLADATRRTSEAAERRKAVEAGDRAAAELDAAESRWTAATEAADAARVAAEESRAHLEAWDRREATLALWDARAALTVARAREQAKTQADARWSDLTRERDEAVAARGALQVPSRAALGAVRKLVGELDGARSAMSVGIMVRIEPRKPLAVLLRPDGAPGMELTASSPIDVEARASVVVALADLATVTVTGGGREARARVAALEERYAAEVEPLLAAAGAEDLAGLESATERAADLDRKLASLQSELEAAARARDALPAADPEAEARVDALVRELGDLATSLADLGDDPRTAWRTGRTLRSRAADEANARESRTAAALTVATADRARATATAAERPVLAPAVEPDPTELPAAQQAVAAAQQAVAAAEQGAQARHDALVAGSTAAADRLRDARAAAADLETRHSAAVASCGGVAARLAAIQARLSPDVAGTDVDRAGWERGLAERVDVRDRAAEARSSSATAAAVAAQRLERAASDRSKAGVPAGARPDTAALTVVTQQADAALVAARAGVEASERTAAERRSGRTRAEEVTVAALAAADAACVAADAAHSASTDALGRERGRLAERERTLAAADRAGGQRRVDEATQALAAVGAIPAFDPATLVDARKREAERQAAAEEAERAVHRQQGALDHVGGAVAEERLREAEAAHQQALQRERETHTDYQGWSLLREVLLEAERNQAANLGGALAPAVSARLSDLTGSRYDRVVLEPHLGTEGVVVAGGTRAAGSLSVGTRDQLSTLVRLCLAERLQTMLVLDDQLVQSDDLKLDWFRRALVDLAARVQVLVFTCRPGDYPGGADATLTDLGRCITRRPT